MRWKPKSKPKTGSWRIVKRFAFFPVLVDFPSKQYVWLEFYQINQSYDLDPWEYRWIDRTKAINRYRSKS